VKAATRTTGIDVFTDRTHEPADLAPDLWGVGTAWLVAHGVAFERFPSGSLFVARAAVEAAIAAHPDCAAKEQARVAAIRSRS
jgi:hypothetical protein